MTTSPEGVTARMLLCDAAQVQGGKLYILGGGWTRVLAIAPINFAIAIQFAVPWHLANKQMALRIDLLDSDGKPFIGPDGKAVQVLGHMEVGRPPGLKQGSTLDNALAVGLTGMTIPPGSYRWDLYVDKDLVESAPFEVLAAPQGMTLPGMPPPGMFPS